MQVRTRNVELTGVLMAAVKQSKPRHLSVTCRLFSLSERKLLQLTVSQNYRISAASGEGSFPTKSSRSDCHQEVDGPCTWPEVKS